jgi:hypothetical protein
MDRRGFLTGAAKLLGGAMALSVLPGHGVSKALAGEKVLWTPEQGIDKNVIVQRIHLGPYTVIQNCTFMVTPDFAVSCEGNDTLIRDCHFTGPFTGGPVINFGPGVYNVGNLTFRDSKVS